MKECFGPVNPHRANATDPAAVLGVLSLVFWSLLLVVCVKYLAFVLRADNKGEGGTMSLAALVQQKLTGNRTGSRSRSCSRCSGPPPLRRGSDHPGDLRPVRGRGPLGAEPEAVVPDHPDLDHDLVGLFWVQRYGTGRSARCSAG